MSEINSLNKIDVTRYERGGVQDKWFKQHGYYEVHQDDKRFMVRPVSKKQFRIGAAVKRYIKRLQRCGRRLCA